MIESTLIPWNIREILKNHYILLKIFQLGAIYNRRHHFFPVVRPLPPPSLNSMIPFPPPLDLNYALYNKFQVY